MKMEKEITVSVTTDYETLEKELNEYNFTKKEEYMVNDIYLINDDLDLFKMKKLDILKKCILIREVENIEKELLYKYKKYDLNGNILEQGKVKCPIIDIDKAIDFMNAINYKELFKINDKCIYSICK